MLYLNFVGSGPGQHATLGPAPSFRVSSNFIRDAKTGEVLAHYAQHYWHVGDKAFTRYECRQKLRIHFEDAEGSTIGSYGPFDGVVLADGSAYIGDRLFAKFMDTALLWHDHESDTFWPSMVLTAEANVITA